VLTSLLQLDAQLREILVSYHSPWLDAVMWTLSAVGVFGAIWLCLASVMAVWMPRLRGAAWQVLLAVVLSQGLVDGVLKPWIARERPFVGVADARVVGYRSTTKSFPSGHATTSFAAATVFAFAIRRRWPFLLLAAGIALSRIYNGVHFPLDITAGSVLGVALGLVVTGGRAWYNGGFAPAPYLVPR
jgi:undecaprenyl-diphosphatase